MSETTPLPPYTGGESEFVSDTRCVKCGWFEATTTYKGNSVRCTGDGHDDVILGPGNPRLCRRCKRCGYAWDEACVDAPSETTINGQKVTIDGATITVHPPEGPLTRPPVPPPGPAADAMLVKDTKPRPKGGGGMGARIAQLVIHEDPSPSLPNRALLEEAARARSAVQPRRGSWG